MNTERTYIIYTDGACLGNGKLFARAGWGAVLRNPDGDVLELCGPVPEDQQQTNGRAELLAIVQAVRAIKKPATIVVYTDSQYIANSYSLWLDGWIERGWRKSDKKPVAHIDLWQELAELRGIHKLVICWVRGHDGVEENERADRLARLGCDSKQVRRRSIPAS